MKIVKINESQMKRLFNESDSIFLDGEDSLSKPGQDAATSPAAAIITGKNGKEKAQDPVNTDRIAGMLSPQNYAANKSNRF